MTIIANPSTLPEARGNLSPRSDVFFDKAPTLLGIIDFNGQIQRVNGRWSEVLGHPVDALVGKQILAFVHADHLSAFGTALVDSTGDGCDFAQDVPLRCSDGTYKWLSFQSHADVGQRLFYVTASDISGRAQSELSAQQHAFDAELRASVWSAFRDALSPAEALVDWAVRLQQRFNVREACIWTVDPRTREIQLQASADKDRTVGQRDMHGKFLEDEVRQVCRTGKPRLVTAQSCSAGSGDDFALLRKNKVEAIVLCPLLPHGQTLGVVGLFFEKAAAAIEIRGIDHALNDMGHALAMLRYVERLRESKQTYDALSQCATIGICRLDRQLRVTAWSPGAEKCLGWKVEEVLGQPLSRPASTECQILETCFRGALDGRATVRLEAKALHADGRLVDLVISVSPIVSPAGEIEQVLFVMSDDTDHRRTQRRLELENSVTRVLGMVNSIDEGMKSVLATLAPQIGSTCAQFWTRDAEADGWTMTADWNAKSPAAERFVKAIASRIVSLPDRLADAVWLGRKPRWFAGISSDRTIDAEGIAARCGIEGVFGLPIVAESGPAAVMLFFASDSEQPDPQLIDCLTTIGDQLRQFLERVLTERRLQDATENLLQAEKMDSIGRLVGGVVHDFNNLLTIILGYGEMVLDRTDAQNAIHEPLTEVIGAGKRAATLTRQLLAFCRKEVTKPVSLDLNVHVREMEKMLRRLIGADVKLETRLASELQQISADPAQIEQVVMNLAVNARDAMAGGGCLTIETRNLELDRTQCAQWPATSPGPHVLLSVADTGFGMDEATKRRIFEPFFTTKPSGKGTGMGLATVADIVHQSGAAIAVDSEPGKGTTFQLLFPAIAPSLSSWKVDAAPAVLPRGTETVLVVDDDLRVRRLTALILQAHGYSPLEASTPDEALETYKRHSGSIKLLIADVVMPDVDGPELFRRVARFNSDIKVLFVSGYVNSTTRRADIPDSENLLLQKPFTTCDLVYKVREILDRKVSANKPSIREDAS